MDFGPKEALEKMCKYCAYQERSHKDVNQKMMELGVLPEWKDNILVELMQQNFLNEERFARAFVRGKFRIKKWGRIKIIHGLKQHQVQKKCIQLALEEIDEDRYIEVLRETIELKKSKLKEKNPWKRKSAIYAFAAQRGFESSLITDAIGAL
ncbi:regulatory protein RecX [Bacteroidota bacterium]